MSFGRILSWSDVCFGRIVFGRIEFRSDVFSVGSVTGRMSFGQMFFGPIGAVGSTLVGPSDYQ